MPGHWPIAHQLPDAHVVEITGAEHYPHETAFTELLPALHDFLQSTAPFRYTETRWRQLLTDSSTLAASP